MKKMKQLGYYVLAAFLLTACQSYKKCLTCRMLRWYCTIPKMQNFMMQRLCQKTY